MSRYAFILLNVFLVVYAHSHPLKPGREPDRLPRDIVDFLDDDFLYAPPDTHDSYETFYPPEATTFPFSGFFPGEPQTRTDGQTQMATATTTTSTASHSGTSHAPSGKLPRTTSTTAAPTSTIAPPNASPSPASNTAEETQAMPHAEAAQWKVIGLVVICITFVGVAILTIVFFDAWWGFLRALVCKRRRGGGKEDMVPDWEKRSWEYKVAESEEEGLRYPAPSAAVSSENVKREGAGLAGVGSGLGMGKGGPGELANPWEYPFAPAHPRTQMVSPQPFYVPKYDPHPLEPLARRPSTNPRSPFA